MTWRQDMEDAMDDVYEDADEVFRYESNVRPQDRAHAYLERRRLARECGDTAMQRAVRDMVERAYLIGRAEAEPDPIDPELAASLAETGAALIRCSSRIREERP